MFLFVHSKSKDEPERLADARIGEFLAAQIEDPALRADRLGLGQGFLLDLALMDRREIIAGRPDARGELLLEGDDAALERLEGHLPVAEILPAHPVEIVGADVHRQIPAPVVRHALELDEAALLETRRPCRRPSPAAAPASRPRNSASTSIFPRTPAARRRPDAGRGCASATAVTDDDVVAFGRRRDQLVQHQPEGGVALGLEQQHREGDVAGRDARAVMEARLRPQPEAVGQPVGRDRRRSSPAARRASRARRRSPSSALSKQASMPAAPSPCSTKVLSVLKVSKLWLPLPRLICIVSVPPLGALRVHIGEMREIGRQRQFAEGREAV